MSTFGRKCLFGALTALIALPACAGQGGGSNYLQGTYGDFRTAIFGPAGLYHRNDLFVYDGSIAARAFQGRATAGVNETVWTDLNKFAYLTDFTIFGARVGTSLAAPIILRADVGGMASTTVGPGLSVAVPAASAI